LTGAVSIAGQAAWLEDGDIQKLLAILAAGGEEARIAGGAVRNTLLGEDVNDIDIATTTMPQAVMERCSAAGFEAIPTGIEHGTVTVVAAGRPIEVTTLRADVETDGRRAKVHFGRDWSADAQRRDFTINALYADADGTVHDPVGGLADIEKREVRFIGNPETRIREDYLRILRFFRFFAHYGSGRPDAEGLKACARLKQGISSLSAERVWSEMKKVLKSRDPQRALLWMRQSSVLTATIPETEKWGIDLIGRLVQAESTQNWAPDAILRLEAIVPPDAGRCDDLARRLKLSNDERKRLTDWSRAKPIAPTLSDDGLRKRLYREGVQPISDRVRLAYAAQFPASPASDEAEGRDARYGRFLEVIEKWHRPVFPLRGRDLAGIGIKAGPGMGKLLSRMESEWAENGFKGTRDQLIARARSLHEAARPKKR
jgi:poly(A) polymerase